LRTTTLKAFLDFILITRLKHAALEKLKKDEDTRSLSSASSRSSIEESPDGSKNPQLTIQLDNNTTTNIAPPSPEDPAYDSIENLLADSTVQNEQCVDSSELVSDSAKDLVDVVEDVVVVDGKPLVNANDISAEEEGTTTGQVDAVLENLTNECSISRQFIDLLFSTVHVKGESRLAQEVEFVFTLHLSR